MEGLPKTTSELLQQLQRESTELEQLLSALSDRQLTELHDPSGWTIQDHLDHLAAWQDGVAAVLEKKPLHEALRVDFATAQGTTEDELNGILRDRTHHTLAQTRAALTGSYEHLLRALAPLSDEDLYRPYSYYQPDDPNKESKPVIEAIVNNSSKHYAEHLPWIQAIARTG